ncbi:hypothetical protein TL16_g09366 [Triparma laevis f. inornata]|uniref:ACT domain-containing protein n=1 Tax=Triparma laevis f. inornata TaxID=1714386 RepID=A0A9W7EM08_9STRA|nr:hypothetical protein TL16_g09366 [Triparma laevis f. inornata]
MSPSVPWSVFKFGGTSVSSAKNYKNCAKISLDDMQSKPENDFAIVVSAMGGKPKTTDLLLGLVEAASTRDDAAVELNLNLIKDKHMTCLAECELSPAAQERLNGTINDDLKSIQDVLRTVSLMKWNPAKISALVSGYGEIWSGQILTEVMKKMGGDDTQYEYVDARKVIVVDESNDDVVIEWQKSEENLQTFLSASPPKSSGTRRCLVVTGFVASNTEGVATTLGRDGSDYSAAIFGKLLSAKEVTIWTDVDGVLSADPRRVPGSLVLSEVSFNEAMELAYFGAKVIHPKTMQPAILSNPPIPIWIRNTFNPSFRGSRIYTSSMTHKQRDRCVCGFASIDGLAILNVEGSGMVGVKGVARRLFGTLEDNGISIILIAQASSEHSISLALEQKDADRAKAVLEEVFSRELKHGHISDVSVIAPASIVAAVGDGMSAVTGVAGRFFRALGESKINVLAIAQGASERNISAIVPGADATRALRAVHAAFRLSQTSVRVGVVLDGGVSTGLGRSLLQLLDRQRQHMIVSFDIDVQVVCVKGDGAIMWTDNGGSITDSDWIGALKGGKAKSSLQFMQSGDSKALSDKFSGVLLSDECSHNMVFDCTALETISKLHPGWLAKSIHVITANNTGISGSDELREELERAELGEGGVGEPGRYLKEVCVGGSLPVIRTLTDLLKSGDRIRKLDGILSVSFSHIMYQVSPPPGDDGTVPEGVKFSEAVKEAISLGMMEVDPVKDLNNEYSARCLMVLVSELGLGDLWNKDRIMSVCEKFIDSESWKKGEGEGFAVLDAEIEKRQAAAKANKCVVRHISSIDVGKSNVEIKFLDVPYNHVFATTPPACETFRFFTKTYQQFPLVITGQAEGLENTANALLAEMLNLMAGKVTATTRKGGLQRNASSAFLGKAPSSPTLRQLSPSSNK